MPDPGLPPLPPGAKLDSGLPPLPSGATLDNPGAHGPSSTPQGGVPALHPGMSDDDVIRAFGYDPNKIKNVSGYQPGMFSRGITDPNGFAAKYILPSIVGGIGHGVSEMKDAYEQAKQHIWGAITGDTSGVDFANLVHAFKNADYNQNWRHRAPGETGFDPSTLIPQAGLTVLAPEIKAMPAARTLIQGAMVGASSPANEDGNFAASKANQVIGGTAGAAASSIIGTGTGKILGWIGGKAADALAGTKLGNVLGLTQELKPQYAGAPQLAADLQSKGIRTTVGDVTGDPAVRAQEDALARNNPKFMAFRLGQNREASNYADSVISGLKKAVNDAGWENIEDVKAVQRGDKRYGAAQALLTAIKNSGDDWDAIAQQSGNLKLFVNKLQSDANFDALDRAAQGPMRADSTIATVRKAIDTINNTPGADKSLLPFYEDIASKLQNRTANAVRSESGTMMPNDAPKFSWADGRQLRTTVNAKLESLNSPNSVVQDANANRTILHSILGSLESDQNAYAKTQGPDFNSLRAIATSQYKNDVVPYKEAAFGKALADTDPLKLANIFQGKNTSQQRRMLSLLGNKGQAAIRLGLVEDAVNAGEKTQRGVMGQTFGSSAAASKLEKLTKSGAMGVAFPGGEDTWAAQGLAKVLRTVDRSDNVGFTPPTGVTAQSIGAKVEGNKTVLGTIAQGVDWLQKDRLMKLYTDPQGKALLQRASDLKVGSPAMGKVIQQISTLLAAQEGAKSAIPLKALIPMAAQNDQLNQPLQITDLRPKVQP